MDDHLTACLLVAHSGEGEAAAEGLRLKRFAQNCSSS
jgi:hypothetical protein